MFRFAEFSLSGFLVWNWNQKWAKRKWSYSSPQWEWNFYLFSPLFQPSIKFSLLYLTTTLQKFSNTTTLCNLSLLYKTTPAAKTHRKRLPQCLVPLLAFSWDQDFETGIQMGAISKHRQQPEWKGIKLMTPNVPEVFTRSYTEFFFPLWALESCESLCGILKVLRNHSIYSFKKEDFFSALVNTINVSLAARCLSGPGTSRSQQEAGRSTPHVH